MVSKHPRIIFYSIGSQSFTQKHIKKNVYLQGTRTMHTASYQEGPIKMPENTLYSSIFQFLYSVILIVLFKNAHFLLGLSIQLISFFIVCYYYINFENKTRFFYFWKELCRVLQSQSSTLNG
jgi:hypothetical protein